MRTSTFAITLVIIILVTTIESEARYRKSLRRSKPYYFGDTNLGCMWRAGKKGKRSVPSRYTLALVHRFIYYDGWYFEFGKSGKRSFAVYRRKPLAPQCNPERESSAAGYSRVSVECLMRCSRRYTRKYGKYSTLYNNCHHFANRIARVLYYYSRSCPSWCD